MKKTILVLIVAVGFSTAVFAEGFNLDSLSVSDLKVSLENRGAMPDPVRPAPPNLSKSEQSGAKKAVGGGDLCTIDRAANDGCQRMVSILVYKTGIKYKANGKELAGQVLGA